MARYVLAVLISWGLLFCGKVVLGRVWVGRRAMVRRVQLWCGDARYGRHVQVRQVAMR